MFGLTSQIRRAAVSVPANIAEGFKRASRVDKARMFNIAQGSLEELRYYLILAQDLGYEGDSELAGDLDEVARLLDAYRRRILSSHPLIDASAFCLLPSVFCLLTGICSCAESSATSARSRSCRS